MPTTPAALLKRFDPWLAGAVAALVAIGLANLRALETLQGDRYGGFALRQFVWALGGLAVMIASARLARNDRHRGAAWLHAVALAAVLAALFGVGADIRGVRRWLRLGPLLVQPSELLKAGVVLATARWFGDATIGARSFARTATGVLGLVTLPALMLCAQPDLGNAALLLMTGAATLAFTPRAWRSLAVLAASVLVPLLWAPWAILRPYQLARLEAFLMPEASPGVAWQARQAAQSLTAGGLFGSRAWFETHHLPDAHTDFALVAWGSLHGWLGTALVLGLFALVGWRCFDVARRADERFDHALCAGIGAMVSAQALVNAAMALGALPVVGIALPLVSYGGSSLVATLFGLGLVLGVDARLRAAPRPPTKPGPEQLYRGDPST